MHIDQAFEDGARASEWRHQDAAYMHEHLTSIYGQAIGKAFWLGYKEATMNRQLKPQSFDVDVAIEAARWRIARQAFIRAKVVVADIHAGAVTTVARLKAPEPPIESSRSGSIRITVAGAL